MIILSCACGKKLQVADKLAGKKVKCPTCADAVRVPMMQPTARSGSDETIGITPAPSLTSPGASLSQSSLSSALDETAGPARNASGGDKRLTEFLSPSQSPDELGRLGEYRILKILGHGGMGVVYLAEDTKLRRKVAIKAMLPDVAQKESSRQRFLREARSAAALEHDHIVPILHVGENQNSPYIVMPLLKGETLEDRVKRSETIPVALVVQVGEQIADALAAAHAKGLLHRDIKPGNIWLETKEDVHSPQKTKRPLNSALASSAVRVKLLDFGLACLTRPDESDRLTQSGAVLGTPGYMAPEQVDGEELDGRADLFSLGCVLYRLCTGKSAFHGNTMTALILSVARDTPREPSKINETVPPALSKLIMQLLAKKRDDRPASASEVVERLRTLDLSATDPSPNGKSRSPERDSAQKTSKLLRRKETKRKAPAQGIRMGLVIAIAAGFFTVLVGVFAIVGLWIFNSPAHPRAGNLPIAKGIAPVEKEPPVEQKTPVEQKPPIEQKTPERIEPPVGWKAYRSAKWGYSIWFPGTPLDSQKPSADVSSKQKSSPNAIHDVGVGLKLSGNLNANVPFVIHHVRFQAGKAYQIDMKSLDPQKLDPYLELLNADGKKLAEDDDGGGNLNARIFYDAKQSAVHQIVARSFSGTAGGAYTLEIAEVALTPAQKLLAAKAAQSNGPISEQVKLDDVGSGLLFMVQCTDFHDRVFPDAEDALNKARDGSVTGSKGTLLSEKRITIGIHPGREIRLTTPLAKGLIFRSRIYLVGQRNYQVVVAGPEAAVEGPAAEQFFQSFHLDREF